MHITDNDKLASLMYGVMGFACAVMRFFSGKVFVELGIKNSMILSFALNVVGEIFYWGFGQNNEAAFFAVMVYIRTITGINMYTNFTIIYAAYGTETAINLMSYFNTQYAFVILAAFFLNYFFNKNGKIGVIIQLFFWMELVGLGYCVFCLRKLKIKK